MKPGLPLIIPSNNDIPAVLHGYISVKGEKSVFGPTGGYHAKSAAPYRAEAGTRHTVAQDLEKSGFTIVEESELGLAVMAPAGAYEAITGGTVEMWERLVNAESRCVRYVTHADLVGKGQPSTLGVGYAASESLAVDGIILQRPVAAQQVWPSPVPPSSPKYHLTLPQDVATLLDANQAHQNGDRGANVLVAMVDSGEYQHPFFVAQGYNVKRPIVIVPGTRPSQDPVGHGTGESANVFAAAPGAVLQPIRVTDNAGNFVAATSGFLRAKQLNPKVLTNSWGGDGPYPPPVPEPDEADRAWALEITDAVEKGICVIFSAGNGHFSVEPQVPGVIAAGGTFVAADMSVRASDYASGFDSPWFGGVRVPTVCGLVGLRPRAQYLMLPVQPGDMLDTEESQDETEEEGDGTEPEDGWAMFSGTSAAAPQVAGVAALLLGAKPNLTPAQVRESLVSTALDVTTGRCHPRFNNPAQVGPDLATGTGLVQATAALRYARGHF
jgi:hypothetical protein